MSISAPAPASTVAPSPETARPVRCPRCEGTFYSGNEACPHCQFSLAAARRSFPFTAPPLGFLVDPTGILPAGAEEVLQAPYSALRESFPQVEVTLALLKLAPGTSLREFAFWWFNEAPGDTTNRSWQLLLLFDAQSGSLCLMPGSALESYLQPANWHGALQKVAAAAEATDWLTALHTFLKITPVLLEADWQRSAPPSPAAS